MDILPYKKIPIDSKFLQKTKVCNLSCDTTFLFIFFSHLSMNETIGAALVNF